MRRLVLLAACVVEATALLAMLSSRPLAAKARGLRDARFSRDLAIMQVAEPPVKIPDKVPDFAPAAPKTDRNLDRGKKFKLLLFNDNVNR